MPITYDCSCGKTSRYKDEFAGKRTRCSACNTVFTIPGKSAPPQGLKREQPSHAKQSVRAIKKKAEEDDLEVIDDDEPPPPKRRRREDSDEMMEVVAVDDEDEDDDRPRKRRPSRDEDEDSAEDLTLIPSKRKKRKKKRKDDSSSVATASILGGIGMMVGAVVWFILGIVLIDRIFLYPPILFILGIVAFVKGLMGEGITAE